MTNLCPCFRWYGAEDPVPLAHIRQMGAEGVVSSLHQLAPGVEWTFEAIGEHRRAIEAHGLRWEVVESLPVSEAIKRGDAEADRHLEHYRRSLAALGRAGIRTVVYNFMPVLDWVRTDLAYRLPDGSECLYFDWTRFAVFELFILGRPEAAAEMGPERAERARALYQRMSPAEREELARNIIDNFPGCAKGTSLDDIRARLKQYAGIDRAALRRNMRRFLDAVVPAACAAGVRLAVHPDDPPWGILGLPRIVSTAADLAELLSWNPSAAHGLNFCAGSLSARRDNDVPELFRRFADRVHFLHLRSTEVMEDGSFYEAGHLAGRARLVELLRLARQEMVRRRAAGRDDWRLPFRPDHGRRMLDDLAKPPPANPGYSAIGRLVGLAEIRGAEAALDGA